MLLLLPLMVVAREVLVLALLLLLLPLPLKLPQVPERLLRRTSPHRRLGLRRQLTLGALLLALRRSLHA